MATPRNKHAAHILRSELKHLKGAIALAAKDVKQDVKRRSDRFQTKMSDSIVEKPFKAVGIAVLSGLFLGLIMRRNKRTSKRYHD